MIRLLTLVFGAARWALAAAVIVGLVSGASRAVLLTIIDGGVNGSSAATTFAVMTVVVLVTDVLARVILIRLAERVAYDVRMQLVRRTLDAPLAKVETIGPARLLAALTDDVLTLVAALLAVPGVIVNIATVVVCLTYLGWLSATVLLSVAVLIVIGVASYYALMEEGIARIRRAVDARNALFGYLRQLVQGTKELQQNAAKRADFLAECLEPAAQSERRSRATGLFFYAVADSWGQLLFFGLIGAVLFALPAVQPLGGGVLVGYVLILLYMLVPLEGLLMAAPQFGRASVALENIDRLGLSLRDDAPAPAVAAAVSPTFRTLELRDVAYRYESGFELGPVDLTLMAGELVYVVGGNGSGKSTLAKVLTGLYEATRGEIIVDGRVIGEAERASYRQLFGGVFADFCLFDRLLGVGGAERDERARRLLGELGLAGKVSIDGGRFSTTELSTGQRKRLALLQTCLEGRPILILDECAADQDPQFKDAYYRLLLPRLRDQGATVLAITHDDRYFHLADRVVKLECGAVIQDELASPPLRAIGEP
jgi:putative ATP-binding cassette transporter